MPHADHLGEVMDSSSRVSVHEIALEVAKIALTGAQIPEGNWKEAAKKIAEFSYIMADELYYRGGDAR